METDQIQNQKVFVTLRGVIELTTEYRRVCAELAKSRQANAQGEGRIDATNSWIQRKNGLEFAIQTLHLPISI